MKYKIEYSFEVPVNRVDRDELPGEGSAGTIVHSAIKGSSPVYRIIDAPTVLGASLLG